MRKHPVCRPEFGQWVKNNTDRANTYCFLGGTPTQIAPGETGFVPFNVDVSNMLDGFAAPIKDVKDE